MNHVNSTIVAASDPKDQIGNTPFGHNFENLKSYMKKKSPLPMSIYCETKQNLQESTSIGPLRIPIPLNNFKRFPLTR